MNPRPRAPFLLCACAALALAACGSSSSSSSTATTSSAPPTTPATSAPSTTPTAKPAAPASAATKLTLSADPTGQLAYVQKSLSSKAGRVTIDFTNPSPVPHNVAVESAGKNLGMTPVITSGSKTLTLTLAKGTYTFFCTVDSHRQAGMQGTLTVS